MTALTFLGAAGEVTGSACLVESDGARFLVDCGLFQGGREAARKNAAAFTGIDLAAVDFIVVTHAHLDHCGLVPLACARGFRGSIYATPATADLMSIMLRDSAQVMEKNAAWRRRHPERADDEDDEGVPLYGEADVDRAMDQVAARDYGNEFAAARGVRIRFADAGHILGAAIVEIALEGAKLVFSGDLGQPARPVVRDPTPIANADVLVIESTYGNRLHRGMDQTVDELVATLTDVLQVRRGNAIVPAFALGRTQELLTLLIELTRARRLRDLQVYIDSPLAKAATHVTLKHAALLDAEARRALVDPGAGGLPIRIRFVESVEESKALNAVRSGAVIIAGSGMCDGGRIKHHLEHNLGRPECGVLFTGFQAAGTLGRKIVDGAPWVRVFGVKVPVRASVHTLGGLSAHADQAALLGWARHFRTAPQATFVVHGEAAIAQAFAERLTHDFEWRAQVPERNRTYRLGESRADATIQG